MPEPQVEIGQEGDRSSLGPGPGRWGDRIEVRGLRLLGVHGALPEEAERSQPFEVDVDLYTDLSQAGQSDDLAATVDYGQLCEVVRSVIGGTHATLLEHLAEQVAEQVLALAGERAQGVAISVRKLRPPVPVELSFAGVRIWRSATARGPQLPATGPGAGDL